MFFIVNDPDLVVHRLEVDRLKAMRSPEVECHMDHLSESLAILAEQSGAKCMCMLHHRWTIRPQQTEKGATSNPALARNMERDCFEVLQSLS